MWLVEHGCEIVFVENSRTKRFGGKVSFVINLNEYLNMNLKEAG